MSKNTTPVLNDVLRSAMKCINAIKANANFERLLMLFSENANADYMRLLLHSEVRWL